MQMRLDASETASNASEAVPIRDGRQGVYAFKDLYCQQQACSPKHFEWKVFNRSLHHPLLTPAVWLLYRAHPQLFRLDTNLIGIASKSDNFSDFRKTVDAYDGFDRLQPDNNFFRRTLHLRISRRKLNTLAHQVFGRAKQL